MNDDIPEGTFVDMEPGETVYEANSRWTHYDSFLLTNGGTYTFLFHEQENGSVSIQVVPNKPFYGNRDTDPHKTHLQYEQGKYFVRWDTPLYSLSDAKQVAAEWAKRTEEYIKRGKPF
jgi:hypothetical protein